MPYKISFARGVEAHLKALTARQKSIALEGIWRHLRTTPLEETRNRKPMRPNDLAPWELRLGSIRVYYDVSVESENEVIVHAIGIKWRNRVRIGSKDYRL